MIDFDSLWKWLSSPFSAGFLGTIASLKWAPGKSWWDRFTNVIVAFCIVRYACPALFQAFGIIGDGYQGCSAFFIGLYSLNLCNKVNEGFSALNLGPLFMDAINNFLPRKK